MLYDYKGTSVGVIRNEKANLYLGSSTGYLVNSNIRQMPSKIDIRGVTSDKFYKKFGIYFKYKVKKGQEITISNERINIIRIFNDDIPKLQVIGKEEPISIPSFGNIFVMYEVEYLVVFVDSIIVHDKYHPN